MSGFSLVNQSLPPVLSSLFPTTLPVEHSSPSLDLLSKDQPILRLVLEAVAMGYTTFSQITDYYNFTLFSKQNMSSKDPNTFCKRQLVWALEYLMQPPISSQSIISSNSTISFLEKKVQLPHRISKGKEESESTTGLDRQFYDEDEENNYGAILSQDAALHTLSNVFGNEMFWSLTPLGEATYRSSLSPEDALFVYRDLQRARDEGLILNGDLHVCYLLCPLKIDFSIQWERFVHILNTSPHSLRNLAELIVGGPISIFKELQTFERYVRAKAQVRKRFIF
jgi:hypothetical protein